MNGDKKLRQRSAPVSLSILLWCFLGIAVSIPVSIPVQAQMMGGGHGMMQRDSQTGFPPPIDPGSLPEPTSDGAKILQRYCAQCHGLPGPGLHTAGQWPEVVARMRENIEQSGFMMRLMHGLNNPSESETSTLTAYLQKHARTDVNVSQLPMPESEGAQAFAQVCAQCHGLPDPKQHTAREWPSTVERMKQNMRKMGKTIPDEQVLSEILEYLTTHAKPN